MIDRLPYELTTGVTATREGLVFDEPAMWIREAFEHHGSMWIRDAFEHHGWRLVEWPDAAEQLRYRKGEPWCHDSITCIFCVRADDTRDTWIGLHRLAAILCDTAEQFRVLHWCVMNLSGEANGK